ncbi:VCBS repeat-containing protein [Streptomyces sp. CRN 30]|uniref:FG-GAP repeat domain-containing protein n=1 Tax=Streptomyces sp. CRN 30 TaxID=3075613 RepID=UPI002A7FEA21|nr:VCBS repeat-containing protein [Streptomyces sp. CRN 30]
MTYSYARTGVLAAGAALALLCACGGGPAGAPGGGAAGSPTRPAGGRGDCVTPTGDQSTDVDGDGRADRVSDPSGSGRRLTVSFGDGSGDGHGTPVTARELAGRVPARHDVLAAVADFDDDGHVDLVLVVTPSSTPMDDPRNAEVRLRFGPVSPAGRADREERFPLFEASGVAVADYDHDDFPDLALYQYWGEGYHQIVALPGERGSGLGREPVPASRYTRPGGEQEGWDRLEDLPRSGLSAFLAPCVS